jgi:hypothetical protein
MKRLMAMAAAVATVGLAAPAHADPAPSPAPLPDGDEAGFLAALGQVGIGYSDPGRAVTSGKAVCACLNNGESGLELVQDVKTRNPGFDMEVASNFAVISAKYFCPHHLSKA